MEQSGPENLQRVRVWVSKRLGNAMAVKSYPDGMIFPLSLFAVSYLGNQPEQLTQHLLCRKGIQPWKMDIHAGAEFFREYLSMQKSHTVRI